MHSTSWVEQGSGVTLPSSHCPTLTLPVPPSSHFPTLTLTVPPSSHCPTLLSLPLPPSVPLAHSPHSLHPPPSEHPTPLHWLPSEPYSCSGGQGVKALWGWGRGRVGQWEESGAVRGGWYNRGLRGSGSCCDLASLSQLTHTHPPTDPFHRLPSDLCSTQSPCAMHWTNAVWCLNPNHYRITVIDAWVLWSPKLNW